MYIFIVLLINLLISWANAYSIGRIWSESKVVGGLLRMNAVIGYILSVIGFTMVYISILVILMPYILQIIPVTRDINLYDLPLLVDNILYSLIGFLIIPIWFFVWFHNVKTVWERRTLGEVVRLGWNTYAQINNIKHYMRNAPTIFSQLLDMMFIFDNKGSKKKDDNDSNVKTFILAITIVIIIILSGWLTADGIVKYMDRKYNAFKDIEIKSRRWGHGKGDYMYEKINNNQYRG